MAVRRAGLEVAVMRREPLVQHIGNLERQLAKPEPARRLLAAIPSVAFNGYTQDGFVHRLTFSALASMRARRRRHQSDGPSRQPCHPYGGVA